MHPYLLDFYGYVQAIAEAAPALVGAYEGAASRIAGECPGVRRVRIPSSLHAGGLLVYLASVGRPEELLVRSPSGKVVVREDLSRAAREGRETCEGESEGAGPPPGGFGGIGETSRIVLND